MLKYRKEKKNKKSVIDEANHELTQKKRVLKITNMANSQLPAIKRRQMENWHDGINYIHC